MLLPTRDASSTRRCGGRCRSCWAQTTSKDSRVSTCVVVASMFATTTCTAPSRIASNRSKATRQQIEAEIRDLAVRARHYKRILDPDAEEHPGVRRELRFLSRWRATTAHPLVMYLYGLREEGRLDRRRDGGDPVERGELPRATAARRCVDQEPQPDLRSDRRRSSARRRNRFSTSVRYQLSTERRFWASDDEIRVAAASRPFYFYGRAEQRRMILERLEEAYGHRELAELSNAQAVRRAHPSAEPHR